KVYMVRQDILNQDQFASKTVANPEGDQNPNDITTFKPFYAGDFDADGQMKTSCLHVEVMGPGSKHPGMEETKYRDPLLYWLIPIYRELKPKKMQEIQDHPERAVLLDLNRDYILHDYLTIQAGDAPWTKPGQGNNSENTGQHK
ncbi:MAG TPA: hypothetical protein VFA18_09305, partial [Gemmataceae bacterium]|nr:hypothetical protein [Gemmataceae bacterium]